MPSLVGAHSGGAQGQGAGKNGRRQQDPGNALAGLIEGEVIPRLLMAHRQEQPDDGRDASSALAGISPLHGEAFADLVLRSEAYALIQHVDAFIARGATVEAILMDLLAPAARRLGEYWEDDVCDFVDVTMGLWRLQEIVHELAARSSATRTLDSGERRALFAAVPGEQHAFGAVMVEEFFRRAGWATCRLGSASQAEIVTLVRRQPFEMIGITAATDLYMERLPGLIDAVRQASANPDLIVMVGGRIFAEEPARALRVGADATAPDARAAVEQAENLLEMRLAHLGSRY